MLAKQEPFATLGSENCAKIIDEQTVVVEYELDLAIAALPCLLPKRKDRQKAIDVVEFIIGSMQEMEPQTITTLAKLQSVLGLPVTSKAPEDLRESA